MILGSTPSISSSKHKFYYMHPQNRFWKVLSNIFAVDFVKATNEEKKDLLLNRNIALYDVIYSCEIINSDDSKITNVIVSDIPKIISSTQIKHLFINGQKAYQLLKKHFPELVLITSVLPSTSPKNATFQLEDLIEQWKILLEYL